MRKEELMNELIKVNVQIHNTLAELNVLRKEKASLVEAAKVYTGELPAQLQSQMQECLGRYRTLVLQADDSNMRMSHLKMRMDEQIKNARNR